MAKRTNLKGNVYWMMAIAGNAGKIETILARYNHELWEAAMQSKIKATGGDIIVFVPINCLARVRNLVQIFEKFSDINLSLSARFVEGEINFLSSLKYHPGSLETKSEVFKLTTEEKDEETIVAVAGLY